MGDAVPPGKAGWFLLIGQMTEDNSWPPCRAQAPSSCAPISTEAQEKELKHSLPELASTKSRHDRPT